MSKQDKLSTNQINVILFLKMYVAASADTQFKNERIIEY